MKAKPTTALGAFVAISAGAVAMRTGYKKAKRTMRRKKYATQTFSFLPSVSERAGLDLEGMRFVASAISGKELSEMNQMPAQDPIRVYAGLAHGNTAQERVVFAMKEMERLGAFDREIIYLWLPTGRGYCHPVPAETLEIIHNGNIAQVAVQYADDKSMAAIKRLDEGAESLRLLLEAVLARTSSQEVKPRIYLYGESMGSWGSVQAMATSSHFNAVSGALWVGLPHDARQSVEHLDTQQIITEGDVTGSIAAPFYLLVHDDDPICHFDGSKLFYRPRPYMKKMGRRWMPGWSFAKMLVSIERATRPTPGVMGTSGHDYRGNIPFVLAAQHGIDPKRAKIILDEMTYREQTRGQRYKFLYSLPIKID